MSDDILSSWVHRGSPEYKKQRMAIHAILVAITKNNPLRNHVYLKGGILMGIVYESTRYTTDIDISNTDRFDIAEKFDKDLFDQSLSLASLDLPYNLILKTQSVKIMPKKIGSFNSYRITVGYAKREPGRPEYRKLMEGESLKVIKIDYSFNESVHDEGSIIVMNNNEIKGYGIHTLVAEKYRSLMQQVTRNRKRRQDVYDLYCLINNGHTKNINKEKLKQTIIQKCEERENIIANIKSLDNPEIYNRAKENYPLLADEVEEKLVDFDKAWSSILKYYKSIFD